MTDAAPPLQHTHAVPEAGGQACAHCGQHATTRRIDWAFIGDEMRRGVLSLEHGLLHTLFRLMFQPGRLLRDYLDGRRSGYVKPLWLLLSTAAVVTLLNRYAPGVGSFGTFNSDMQAALDAGGTASAFAQSHQHVATWVYGHLALATLLVLPLEAAFLQLGFWRVRGLNYPEWLTIVAYLTAQSFVLWSIGIALRGIVPNAETWAMQIAMLYLLVSLVFTFDTMAWWKSALRGFFGLTAYMLVTGVLFTVSMVFVVPMVGAR